MLHLLAAIARCCARRARRAKDALGGDDWGTFAGRLDLGLRMVKIFSEKHFTIILTHHIPMMG